ncbi:methyltransferase [Mycobacterium sp. CBMA271]|uniref:O-methyltransferase n=1 Tax=unclassified Mycobacteroides TaxID=2618759 RepID=UPI0012DCADDD|nr:MULTISPECIES: class I SAM-dependent methyltransferase [unclassified Mycobacteroides]MUM17887.1 methyltransferase [Mycobacteroides sp. CBMA 326]MUM20457.1 methyltransferase [Mycobacteroides sp. CBMA 271]
MTTTLHEPAFATIVDRLFENASHDAPPVDRDTFHTKSVEERVELFTNTYVPVAPEAGRLLYSLVRAAKPKTIVEYGLSYGISTLHLSAAVRDNGFGRIITTELNTTKIAVASATFAEAGVADLITILEGDARETLKTIDGPIDFLLLDGWPDLDLPVLTLLEDKLSPGALVIADNVAFESSKPYLEYVRNPENGYVSVPSPVGEGMELSSRCG